MNRMWLHVLAAALIAGLTLLPTPAYAQGSSIVGIARDTTGAALPGVTVEAASPALIERVRTVVSDGEGQYRIVDLRPGTYTVTFTLPGFGTVRREGITLSTGFTATVNGSLGVSTVEETVVVTGASPVVDIQNVQQQRVVTKEVVDAIPSGRTEQTIAALIPGMSMQAVSSPVVQDVGGSTGDMRQTLSFHGSGRGDFNEMIEGIPMNAMTGTFTGGINMDTGAVQEFNYEVGAISAERALGGVLVNIIPREGANSFSGSFVTSYTNSSLNADNIDDALRARGVSTTSNLHRNWDLNPSFGGPIKRDKLWFFASGRSWGYDSLVANMWNNKTPFAPIPTYTPDLSSQAIDTSWLGSVSTRLTYQLNAKNKFGFFGIDQGRCLCNTGVSATTAPEAARQGRSEVDYLLQGSWSSPLTSNILLEAAAQTYRFEQEYYVKNGVTAKTLSVREQTTGLTFNAPAAGGFRHNSWIYNYRGSISYLTGANNLKAGFTLQNGDRQYIQTHLGDLNLTTRNGIPNGLTVFATPYQYWMKLDRSLGLYVQDQWTIRRVTLNLGLRYDNLVQSNPAQDLPAVQFLAARSYAEMKDVVNWKDLSPRLGVAVDVFGTGKTAFKASFGKYLQGETIQFANAMNPVNTSVNQANRTWNDLNGNFYPDCDFRNLEINGECGVISNRSFGSPGVVTRFDEAIRKGWGARGYNSAAEINVQQELMANVSVSAGYSYRSYGNHLVVDNLAVAQSDYTFFNFTAPSDPNLPGGGGYTLRGLADVNPNKFGQVDNLVTFAKNYGKQFDRYNGVDVTIDARLPRRGLLRGGVSVGRQHQNNCDVVTKVDNLATTIAGLTVGGNNYSGLAGPSAVNCDVKPPFQTQVKLQGTTPLPGGFDTALVFQSVPGVNVTANYTAPNSQVAAALGRNLSSGANGTTVIGLVGPGQLYGDRIYQVDLRTGRTWRIAGMKVRGNLDVYNMLNDNSVLLENNTYGPAWRQPAAVLVGRLFKFSAQIDF